MGVSAPPGPMVYCETPATPLWTSFATYAFLPLGPTAIPSGNGPEATVAGVIGVNAPPAPTVNCDTPSAPGRN